MPRLLSQICSVLFTARLLTHVGSGLSLNALYTVRSYPERTVHVCKTLNPSWENPQSDERISNMRFRERWTLKVNKQRKKHGWRRNAKRMTPQRFCTEWPYLRRNLASMSLLCFFLFAGHFTSFWWKKKQFWIFQYKWNCHSKRKVKKQRVLYVVHNSQMDRWTKPTEVSD